MEMLDRTQRMEPLFPYGQFGVDERERAGKLYPRLDLAKACRSSAVDFVVSGEPLDGPPLASLALNDRYPKARLSLYRCSDLRS
jgi:hypothetical protein